ncbi:helix-turn-helix domain-containing protein [Prosthecobacter sp. SYSU 5D2]|uniref:helix-turn-helix domain-containing protein n=1 Tax=Prosthecobacter sp. SYSU 5D2 TaxID=3134134 RepID=UPI0031FE67F7
MTALPGTYLRSARVRLGLSLEDAAHKTRIPQQRLEWLEEDNFAAFGSLTYARAFLKIYSRFLGVDASEILEELPCTRLRPVKSCRYLSANQGRWLAGQDDLQLETRRKGLASPMTAGMAIFVLLLMGSGVWGYHISRQSLAVMEAHSIQRVAEAVHAPAPASGPPHQTVPLTGLISSSQSVQAVSTRSDIPAHNLVITSPMPAIQAGIPAGMD